MRTAAGFKYVYLVEQEHVELGEHIVVGVAASWAGAEALVRDDVVNDRVLFGGPTGDGYRVSEWEVNARWGADAKVSEWMSPNGGEVRAFTKTGKPRKRGSLLSWESHSKALTT